jgi:hypothetical protein
MARLVCEYNGQLIDQEIDLPPDFVSPLMRFQMEVWKMQLKNGEKVLIGTAPEDDAPVYELGLGENEELIVVKTLKFKDLFPES